MILFSKNIERWEYHSYYGCWPESTSARNCKYKFRIVGNCTSVVRCLRITIVNKYDMVEPYCNLAVKYFINFILYVGQHTKASNCFYCLNCLLSHTGELLSVCAADGLDSLGLKNNNFFNYMGIIFKIFSPHHIV